MGVRTFYHEVPRPLAERALSMVASDAPAGVDGVVAATRERFGSIPRTWVLCTEDRVMRPALQRRLALELDEVAQTPTRVVEVNSSHSPFLSQPGLLASAIADAAITLSR